MLLEKWTPLRELDLVDRRMRRIFSDLGLLPAFVPAADVYETDDELVVELEVPGFDESELEIEVTDHTLCICGERMEETEKEEAALHLRERLESRFERRFVLPGDIDGERMTAAYEKGVLKVHAPKPAQAVPRKIEIAKA